MGRTIPMILTPGGWESYHVYQQKYGPYSWKSQHPHKYGLLDSIANAGFLPETSMDEVQYLEEYGYAQRIADIEEPMDSVGLVSDSLEDNII